MIPESSSRQVQSIQTAFKMIGILQDFDGATMPELASQMDLAKSTVYNYLGTLQSLGYVIERDGTYRLGLRFLTNGMAAKNSLPLRATVTHVLPDISQDLAQSTWWVVEEYGRGLFVENAIPEDSQPIYGRVGKRSYLHPHAPGKAILAQLTDEHVRQIIEHYGLPIHTRETITDADDLIMELKQISKQGYAISDSEAALGVRSVGVAFEGPSGCMHGLGVFGHSHDFNESPEDVPSVLLDAVDTIKRSATGGGE